MSRLSAPPLSIALALALVTHQLIVTSLTGVFPESGEVVVAAPERNAAAGNPDNRTLRLIGTIKSSAAK